MMPMVMPSCVPSPIIALAPPRWERGNRSAVMVVSGAWRKFSATWMTTQNTVIQTRSVSEPIPKSRMPPTKAPSTIHGERRPNRERVRSLKAPAIGWAKSVKTNETVVTIARFASFCSSPNSSWICVGRRIAMRPP